ncbi:hypothetical protein, partial [Rhodococcus sp. CX]|uniref:hypothetical protein n=1 Tax=Rhodococcus sp. CX TaxID=2789880 RepID=UPI0027DB80F6
GVVVVLVVVSEVVSAVTASASAEALFVVDLGSSPLSACSARWVSHWAAYSAEVSGHHFDYWRDADAANGKPLTSPRVCW